MKRSKKRSKKRLSGLKKRGLKKRSLKKRGLTNLQLTGIGLASITSIYAVNKILNSIFDTDHIYNNYDPDKIEGYREERYVNGPLNITHYQFKKDNKLYKEIYMFGEIHIITNPCSEYKHNVLDIPIIFDYIIKSNPHITIDFFIEKIDKPLSFISDIFDSMVANTSKLLLTRSYFANIGIFGKKRPNLRIHGIDVRQTHDYTNILLLLYLCYKIPNTKLSEKGQDIYKKYLYPDEIFIKYKIIDQINRISDNEIKTELLKYAKEKLNVMIEQYKNNCTANNMFIIMSFYMDIYTIGLIFRTNPEQENKYIIIYVGELHRITIHEFLTKLKNIHVKNIYGDTNITKKVYLEKKHFDTNLISQCVNISNSDLPFFNTEKKLDNDYIKAVKSNSQKQLNDAYLNYKE